MAGAVERPYDYEMDYSGLFVIGVLRKPPAGHQVSLQPRVQSMLNEEEGWIAEFEAAGEDEVRIRLYRASGMHPEAKFHTAVRWLHEQARAHKVHEEEIHRYVWWTLCAAVLSVIIGIIVLAVTWFGR
jgi:hypothetical protein